MKYPLWNIPSFSGAKFYQQRNNFFDGDKNLLTLEIDKLLFKRAIIRCNPVKGQFLSPFFLVPKSNGFKRFILNLKILNQFIETSYFKIKDLMSTLKLISPNYFMCNLNLKNAYFLIPVGENSRKFLWFKFKRQNSHVCLLASIRVLTYLWRY